MRGITKSFPGVKALDGARLEIRGGEVHALMGENGAGKSTLMKCLFGVYEPDGGEIILEGRNVKFDSPRDALEGGVAMVHQELEQAGRMTVTDNMWLGRYIRIHKLLPLVSKKRCRERTREVFEELGLDINPDQKVENLSVGQRQMVEIAKAVSYGARVIVFDEPTSSLTEREAEILFGIIERLKAKMCGIVYISHKMSEILRISDRVTVMRDGKYIATKEKEGLTTDEIIRLMVGREMNERYPKLDTPPVVPLLNVENLTTTAGDLKNVSISVGEGEIVGIGGLEGAGRTELLESIFGMRELRHGNIELSGEEIKNRSPREAKANGFALLTEERRNNGIFGILGITENTTVSSLKDYRTLFLLSRRKMDGATREYIKALKIKTPSERTRIRSLSGGNQQKVILARWLLTKPRILLLDEPTRGIDVGAKYDIYLLIRELAKSGCGIILVSSEMPELIGITHRIVVLSNGRVAGELRSAEATQEAVMTLAAKYL